jgi:hypothetical protein
MTAGRCDNFIGSVRFGRSIAPFFQYVKSYLIKNSENLSPKAGLSAPCLRLFLCLHIEKAMCRFTAHAGQPKKTHTKAVVPYGNAGLP